VLAVAVVERLGERRAVERREHRRLPHDVGDREAEHGQRGGHLAPDEAAADDGRGPRRERALAQRERVVDRPQRERAVEVARPGAGRDHDRVRLHVVERRDDLAAAEVDPVEADQRILGLRLAAEERLGERRPVVRAVRVLRPDDDLVAAARLAISLDELRRREPASDDSDHVSSRSTALDWTWIA
jgi:hypothetical protein